VVGSLVRGIAHHTFADIPRVLVFLLPKDGLLESGALLAMLLFYADLERMPGSEISTFDFGNGRGRIEK